MEDLTFGRPNLYWNGIYEKSVCIKNSFVWLRGGGGKGGE